MLILPLFIFRYKSIKVQVVLRPLADLGPQLEVRYQTPFRLSLLSSLTKILSYLNKFCILPEQAILINREVLVNVEIAFAPEQIDENLSDQRYFVFSTSFT